MVIGNLAQLTLNEQWLQDQVESQREADGTTPNGGKRTVRAQFIRELALASSRPAGLRLRGLKVVGELDLSYADIAGPLMLRDCKFYDDIDCSKMTCVEFDLSECEFPQLLCDQARIAHDVKLPGVKATRVSLVECRIGGQLNLTGSTFTDPGGTALNADGAQIVGDVFCRDEFCAEGETRLIGAVIGGQVDLTGGTFSNPHDVAVCLDNAQITGGVFCGTGFSALGKLTLRGTTVDSYVDLSGGTFRNPGSTAVDMQRAKIVTLIASEFDAHSSGDVDLVGAHVDYLSDSPSGWRRFRRIDLLDLTYDRVKSDGWTVKGRLDWLLKASSFQNQPYEQLAHVLREQGQDREARRVLIAKNNLRRKQQNWLNRFGGLLFGMLLGYGYRPLQRTLPALVLLYLVGALWLLPDARNDGAIIATRAPVRIPVVVVQAASSRPPQPIVAGAHCPTDYSCFSRWAYAADVLIPLIDTHQTDYWTITSVRRGRWAILYSRFATILGWALSTAAALGFTGLIRRD